MVATEYEQDCPEAQITIGAVGSTEGRSDLEHGNKTPVVAMSDGLPQQLPGPQYVGKPVGGHRLGRLGFLVPRGGLVSRDRG
jgi:hypothetical protein